MEQINYQKQLEKLLESLKKTGKRPSLLLHSCCAPCSSYVISYLADYFDISIFYFNPNIYPKEEYEKRKSEQIRLIQIMNINDKQISFTDADYDYQSLLSMTKGHENEPEGGQRCTICYKLRLEQTAKEAKQRGFDYFATTLTVSPYKNAKKLNNIGNELEAKYGIIYLISDFKKCEGYKKSIQLSKEYNLYRQEYCGCEFSLSQAKNYSEKVK